MGLLNRVYRVPHYFVASYFSFFIHLVQRFRRYFVAQDRGAFTEPSPDLLPRSSFFSFLFIYLFFFFFR
jgi:hypothetical protein